MIKKIIAGIFAALLLTNNASAFFLTKEAEDIKIDSRVLIQEEIVEEEFEVELINNFSNPEVDTMTLEQLKNNIQEQEQKKHNANNLINYAISLNWPEDCQAIQSAKNEWYNAEQARKFYVGAYNKKIKKLEDEKWAAKKQEYPEATEVWKYMKSLGWNDAVCAGIMGNIMTEVGGQTLNINPYARSRSYYGICQWNKGYSDVWGGSLKKQCDFLRDTVQYEFDTFGYAYKKEFNYESFLNMADSRQAALAFAKCYERCGSQSYKIRQDNAEKAYNYFVN